MLYKNKKGRILKLIVGCFLLIPLVTFAQKNSTLYEINGTIDNLEDGTNIYLNTFLNSTTDTAIVRNGKFRFVGNVSCPTVTVLNFGAKSPKAKIFWLENIKMHFTGFGNNLDKSVITGSGNMVEFEKLKNAADSLQGNDSLGTAFIIAYMKMHPGSYLGGVALLFAMSKIPHLSHKLSKLHRNII